MSASDARDLVRRVVDLLLDTLLLRLRLLPLRRFACKARLGPARDCLLHKSTHDSVLLLTHGSLLLLSELLLRRRQLIKSLPVVLLVIDRAEMSCSLARHLLLPRVPLLESRK